MSGAASVFDKFGWLKAAQSDDALTDRDFRLAALIAVSYTRADGTGWAVELDALAAALPGGLSRRRLLDALGRLQGRGYLVETDRRSVGGRGVTARRSFDLAKPLTPASRVNAETPDASGTGLNAETPDASVQNPRQQRPKPLTPASRKVAADLPEPPLTGTSSGTSSGGAPPKATGVRGPYGPRCTEHAFTTDPPNCLGCRDARVAEESRQLAAAQDAQNDRAAVRRAIDACDHCDSYGRDFFDADVDCPHHSNFRQLARSTP